jgi:tellurite resistance protein TerC
MRAIFIFFGLVLIQKFHWILYIFAIFLIISGIRLGLEKEKEYNPEHNFILRLLRRFLPTTSSYHGKRFFIKEHGKYLATPLFVALCAIEMADILFALDSIPAVMGITTDPFIVYTSNILAVLGLRALYFALAHALEAFVYLHYALAFILVFIGVKMLLDSYLIIPIALSLGVIFLTLFTAMVFSLWRRI